MLKNRTMMMEKALLWEVPYIRGENETDQSTNLSWVDLKWHEKRVGLVGQMHLEMHVARLNKRVRRGQLSSRHWDCI